MSMAKFSVMVICSDTGGNKQVSLYIKNNSRLTSHAGHTYTSVTIHPSCLGLSEKV